MEELKIKAEAISYRIRKEMGDQGTCISGYDLLVDNKQLINQPTQGSLTCEKVYAEVKTMLIENGIDQSRIKIDYGRMD